MGKVADIERLKLKATFLNGMAIGLGIAGTVVPFVALLPKFSDFLYWMAGRSPIAWDEVWRVAVLLLSTAFFAWSTFILRRRADKTIAQISD